jgi:hypothetical protein
MLAEGKVAREDYETTLTNMSETVGYVSGREMTG